MLAKFWHRRILILASTCFILGTIAIIYLLQPEARCRIWQVKTRQEMFDSNNGGMEYHGRFLVTNCYMVVTYLQPEPEDHNLSSYGQYYDAFVVVIGGQLQRYMGEGVYQLVRFQVADDCRQAQALAAEFLNQMQGQGLYAQSLDGSRSSHSC